VAIFLEVKKQLNSVVSVMECASKMHDLRKFFAIQFMRSAISQCHLNNRHCTVLLFGNQLLCCLSTAAPLLDALHGAILGWTRTVTKYPGAILEPSMPTPRPDPAPEFVIGNSIGNTRAAD
jgi:hypothetical protein